MPGAFKLATSLPLHLSSYYTSSLNLDSSESRTLGGLKLLFIGFSDR